MSVKNYCNINGIIFAKHLKEVSDAAYITDVGRKSETSAFYQFGFAYGRKFDNTLFNGIMYAMTKRAAIIDKGDFSAYFYNRKRYSRYISKAEIWDHNFVPAEDAEETRHYTYIKESEYDDLDYIVPLDAETGLPVSRYTGYTSDIYKRYKTFLRHVFETVDLEKRQIGAFDSYFPSYQNQAVTYKEDVTTYMARTGMPEMRTSITGEADDYNVLVEKEFGKKLLKEQYNYLGAFVNAFAEVKVLTSYKEIDDYCQTLDATNTTTNNTMISACIANRTQHDIVDLAIGCPKRFMTQNLAIGTRTVNNINYIPYIIQINSNMSEKSLDFIFLTLTSTFKHQTANKTIEVTLFPIVILNYNISTDIPAGVYRPTYINKRDRLNHVDNSTLQSKSVQYYMQPRYFKNPYSSDLRNMTLVKRFNVKGKRGLSKSLKNLTKTEINNMYYDFTQAFIKHLNEV